MCWNCTWLIQDYRAVLPECMQRNGLFSFWGFAGFEPMKISSAGERETPSGEKWYSQHCSLNDHLEWLHMFFAEHLKFDIILQMLTRRIVCNEGAFFSWWSCLCVGLGEVEGEVGRVFWFGFELGLGCRLSWSMLLDRPFPSNPTLFNPMAEKNRRRESLGRPSRCSASVPTLKHRVSHKRLFQYVFCYFNLNILFRVFFAMLIFWHQYKGLRSCSSHSVGGSVVI